MVKKVGRKGLPSWLPKGWTKEVRPRGNGGTYNRYICPISNLKFYSKPEVFRYLQNPRNGNTRPRNQTSNENINKSTSKPLQCEVKKVIASGVASRSEKEVRATKESRKPMIDKRCQVDEKKARDSRSKLCTGGKVGRVPDCKPKRKMTKGLVNRVSNKNVDSSKRMKGMDSSVVHMKEDQVRNILKQLQGPIRLPAEYIPHFQGALRSISGENVAETVDSPFHYVLTDPFIIFTRTSPPGGIST